MTNALLPLRIILLLFTIGIVGEIILIMPFVDRYADENPAFHAMQHGLIFLGGVIIGVCVRDLYLRTRQ